MINVPEDYAEQLAKKRAEYAAQAAAEAAERQRHERAAIKMFAGFITGGVLLVASIVALVWSVTLVSAGHRGAITRFGRVVGVAPEGLSFKRPFSDISHEVSVQIQKYEVKASAASKDLQDVSTTVAVNFHVMPSEADWVYQNLRGEYTERVISPAVQEVVKAATAKFNAEDMVRSRDTVKNIIQTALAAKMAESRLKVTDVSLVNFEFSQAYSQSIEAKQVAEQTALKAENDLVRIKTEAQQQIETAKAQAEMLRLQREQVTPMMLQLEWIKKWDGHMPAVNTGGGQTLLDVSKYAAAAAGK